MTPVAVFNLCTLYDLAYTAEQSKRHKYVLKHIAGKYNLAALTNESFRL